MNLKELLKLAGQQGKVVVVGDDGEVRGVFVSFEEYQELNASRPEKVEVPDPEKINREILEAQLKDNVAPSNHNLEMVSEPFQTLEPIGQILQERAQSLFISKPAPPSLNEISYDPRDESEHPSVQRTASPTISIAEDEEIRPNFDDI